MKCQGKDIKPDEVLECNADANGMFRTVKGVLPLCKLHADWVKEQKLIVNTKDNYFG